MNIQYIIKQILLKNQELLQDMQEVRNVFNEGKLYQNADTALEMLILFFPKHQNHPIYVHTLANFLQMSSEKYNEQFELIDIAKLYESNLSILPNIADYEELSSFYEKVLADEMQAESILMKAIEGLTKQTEQLKIQLFEMQDTGLIKM